MGIQINGQTDTIKAIDGTMTMPGTVTYEDVSRVNVTGIVTAGQGLHVTGGSAGIGLASPVTLLHVQQNSDGEIFRVQRGGGSNVPILRINLNETSKLAEFEYTGVDANGNISFKNGGNERLRITSTGNVGIATDNPQTLLHLKSDDPTLRIQRYNQNAYADVTVDTAGKITFKSDPGNSANGDGFSFTVNNSEKLHLTSDGDMGLGTGSPTGMLHLFKNAAGNTDVSFINLTHYDYGVSETGQSVTIRGLVRNDGGGQSETGAIRFGKDSDYSSAANRDGNIQFLTNNSNSFDVRMTIYSTGQTTVAHDTSTVKVLRPEANSTSYSSDVLQVNCARSASTAYSLFKALSGNLADVEFKLDGNGIGYSDGGWTTPASDYAEFFEWVDGNPNNEDRRGISVVLDGTRIREAIAGEDPLGVISARPSIVGDAATDHWKEKHLTDQFGSYIMETHNIVSWKDEDGKKHSYEDWNIPADVVVPDDAVIAASDENGIPFTHRKLNPDYDPNQSYISRADRPEWDVVGLLGKLRMHKGQVTSSRWIKMRDISDSIEEWLVR